MVVETDLVELVRIALLVRLDNDERALMINERPAEPAG
jgi:hypothetical protein